MYNVFKSFIFFILAVFSNSVLSQDKYFNPKPSKDDVIVSMPCGFSMAFVKVYTSYDKDHKLRDFAFYDGDDKNSNPISNSHNKCYVQGAFHDENGFYMLISKYEITDAQYKALTNKKCPTLSVKSKFPAVNITYNEALKALENYSLYLQKAQDGYLQNSKRPFAILPTSCEWSFAQRGGLKVKKEELESNLSGINGDLKDYAFYQGPNSANGKLQTIGLLKQNPLGLYDMLGNASEMMSDRFSATLKGRSHGQSGGILVRGGSFKTSKNRVNSSYRSERPFINEKGGLFKSNDTGFRLMLTLPVIGSIAEAQELNDEAKKLSSQKIQNEKDLSLSTDKHIELTTPPVLPKNEIKHLEENYENSVKSQVTTNLSIEEGRRQNISEDDSIFVELIDSKSSVNADLYVEARNAQSYFNERVTVCGILAQTKYLKRNSVLLLNLDKKYPHQSFVFVVKNPNFSGIDKVKEHINRKICAFGKIEMYKDSLEIEVEDIDKLKLM